jgi:beta-lactamase class A
MHLFKSLSSLLLIGSLVSCGSPKQEAGPAIDTATTTASNKRNLDSLRERVSAYLKAQPADVGFAIYAIEDGDTMSYNGDKMYSLMSVTKFPQALKLLKLVDEGKISASKPLKVTPEHLTQQTASTLKKDHPYSAFELSIPEVLRYAVGQSDNISSNVMFDAQGGPDAVTKYLRSVGIQDMTIGASYRNGQELVEKNRGTPKATALLLKKFLADKLISDSSSQLLWMTMERSLPGADRIKGQLPEGTVVAHKTGTSGTNATGAIIALNDAGIIRLPNGKHIAIAAFVGNSKASPEASAKIIATASKMVWDEYVK